MLTGGLKERSMKRVVKFIFLFSIGFFSYFADGQSTVVTATVQSPVATPWAFGTLSYKFKPVPNFSGISQWQGADLPAFYLTPQTITLGNTGAGTFTVPSNTAITPLGSSWTVTVCPQATVQCVTTDIPGIWYYARY